jgi:uncharacterized protein (TIGR02246 family)
VQSLREIAYRLQAGANSLDVDRQFSIFSEDADFTWANDGRMFALPRDSLAAIYRAAYRGYRAVAFTWDSLRVAPLARDAGVLTGQGRVTVTDTAGHVLSRYVVATYVFVRHAGDWKLVHGHASHRPM